MRDRKTGEPRGDFPWLLALALLALAGGPPAAAAQEPAPSTPDDVSSQRVGDPYDAYAAGRYDRALQGFIDLQVERPEDPALALNIGSSHYQMKDYAEAEKAFLAATLARDPGLRARALYNLGNTAYRQGRLEDAIGYYQATLDLAPDDQDAKFNLEFVRDEIRRRHEEAQKEKRPPQEGQDQPQQDQPQDGQEPEGQEQGQSPEDRDGDGLPDQLERSAANPTDPENPDTDGDGLADGAEDANRNGQVDPGETDPTNPDTDGDGVADGAEARRPEGGEPAPRPAAGAPEPLSQEEAERYLQALEEGRPRERHPAQPGQRTRPDKDW